MSQQVIKVTGTGKMSVAPDQICLTFSLEDTVGSYEKAVKMSVKKTQELKNCLVSLNFKESDLKTLSFYVNTNFDQEDRKKIVSYSFVHRMKLVFDRDEEQLSKILEAVSNSETKATYQIEYLLKDPEKIKSKLMEQAVKDSKRKAEVLALAAEVKLGNIVEINYSWDQIELYSRPMSHSLAVPAFLSKKSFNIEPEEISISDTVTVVWEIER